MTRALTTVWPEPTLDRLLADLVPPPRFESARLSTYIPDDAHPSQAEAKERIGAFAHSLSASRGSSGGLLSKLGFGGKKKPQTAHGLYLDGGFGVGKTHLLTSLFHETQGKGVYGTFVEYTNLVGALGFQKALDVLSDALVVCIDEFELDDPGDTLLMTRLIRELSDRGVAIVATSNTLPEALGEGRFAAQDFLREIQAMSERFDVLRIDGQDYRGRSAVDAIPSLAEQTVRSHAETAGEGATLDTFEDLLVHLGKVHPSRYGAMIDGVDSVHLLGVRTMENHNDALRFVVLIDRLYDREIPILASGADGGEHLPEIYTEKLLTSGYRKKYFRSLSRLASLARDGEKLVSGS